MGCSLMKSALFVCCVIKWIVDHATSATVHNLPPYSRMQLLIMKSAAVHM